MQVVVRGTGMHVPDNVVDNDRISRLMDTSDEWIRRRTGIAQRRFADIEHGSSDLALPAARAALDDAGMKPEEVDYLIFATMTPDHFFPGSGTALQHKLGLGHVPSLDIRQQCAGFLYGLQLATAVIRSGQHRNVLLVGAEVHGGFMPWSWDLVFDQTDRKITADEYANNTRFRDRVVLFGDGAGVFVLSTEPDGDSGIIDVMVHSDGAFIEKMWVNGGGSRHKPYFTPKMYDDGDTVPIVEGREVFRAAVTLMPESVEKILARNGLGVSDLRLLIMHQANLRINEAVQKRLELPDDKVYNNIQKYGNTTAATLPMAFHEARTERNLKPGDLVAFTAVGSGLNWGAALYRV